MVEESKKELKWQEPIEIENGEHTGLISGVAYRDKPYEYTDVLIKLDHPKKEIIMKYGCPTIASENSKLGKLLVVCGAKYESDKKIVPEEILVGKKIKFMTLKKESKKDKKEYAEIVEDSIKLI